MPRFEQDPSGDCVVTFGTSGWSSFFYADIPTDGPSDKCQSGLIERARRLIPVPIKESHPANADVKWIKIYRLEKHVCCL